MQNRFSRFLIFFLLFFLIFQFFSRPSDTTSGQDITIQMDSSFTLGEPVSLQVVNHSEKSFKSPSECPDSPVMVEYFGNGEWVNKTEELAFEESCSPDWFSLNPKQSINFSFAELNSKIFSEKGKYRLSYQVESEEKIKTFFSETEVVSAGFFKAMWNEFFYRPIFNTLFFIASKLPGRSLGWSVIILTLIIKIILLVPNQKALKSQRQMQLIQPQLDAIKQKYKDQPQLMAQKTMEVWKKHKVSPWGSCLPILVQFPILIALFYVVRDGLNVVNPNLFYVPLQGFDVTTVNPIFLQIIDLTKNNLIVLPLIVAGLQFFQIRLSLARVSKKPVKSTDSPLPMMNQMMQYVMPVMIAIFTASLPAAVGFYWGTSTLFAIGQQWFVNRSK